jgi:hypothetical protein
LDGEQRMIALVFGVMARSSASGDSFHPSSSLGVADPVGLGDDHLVAGLEQREREVEEGVLGAHADADVLGLGEPAAHALGRLADGLLEGRDAGDGRVLGAARVDRALGGFEHVSRRIEVGLAHAEREDVDALGLEIHGPRVHRERDAGGNDLESGRVAGGHGARLARPTLWRRRLP